LDFIYGNIKILTVLRQDHSLAIRRFGLG